MFRIAVIIPCYKVRRHILDVLSQIGDEVSKIYIIDDACPENTSDHVKEHTTDPRVRILQHQENQGVGGACLTGIHKAIEEGADIIVKIDGDGQMDAGAIKHFVYPISEGLADFVKGNRYYSFDSMSKIPLVRRLGNLFLSFMTKLSSGYYQIFDPTNGFIAMHADVASLLEAKRISSRYFFESDLLFHLSILDAKVCDIPMTACYGDEQSSLQPMKVIPEFFLKNSMNFLKRIFYNYFLRDFNPASIALVLGLLLTFTGTVFGLEHWVRSVKTSIPASAGTVMLAALQVLLGLGFLHTFFVYDFSRKPTIPLHKRMISKRRSSN